MKRITRKYVLLLTMIFSLFSARLHAQCGVPPIAYPGTINCNGGTANVPIDLNLMGGPYRVTPYLDYSFPTMNDPWDYAYNHPGPSYTVTNLPAAPNHKIYIVDLSIGCYDSVMFTLTEPTILNMANLFQSPASCSGMVQADFTLAGGTPPYTISYTSNNMTWNNLTTTFNTTYSTQINLGPYQWKLTDNNGCVVNQPLVFGSAATDQAHWYIGMCGVTDSSIQYLTGGNQNFTRNITLLMQGLGTFTDTLWLEVDFGDNSPLATFGTEVAYTHIPMPVNHTYSAPGVYKVTYTAINISDPDTVVVVEFINNNSDVYPGDANGDGIANNFDLLNIGMGFGATGPARPGASLSWTAQPCADWTQSFTTGLNYKHADCDGNATIDYPDTNAIIVNYGQSHVLRLMEQPQGGPGSPDLVVDFPAGSYPTGTPVTVPVTLGNSSVPATDIYGIAFSVNYPVNAFDANSVNVSFNSSWLGDVGTDAVAIRKNISSSGSIDIAISRNDQTNITGYGTLCELGFITIDNVSGKMTLQGTEYITFSNVRLIDKDGYEIAVNTVRDSITINGPTGINTEVKSGDLKVYPNPAKDHMTIKAEESIEEIQVMNIFGQVIMTSFPNANEARIATGGIESGMYMVKIKTANNTGTRRIEIIK